MIWDWEPLHSQTRKVCDYCGRKKYHYDERTAFITDIRLRYQPLPVFGLPVRALIDVFACGKCYSNLTNEKEPPMARKFWTTQEGKQIAIKDMDLGHLANTIKYLGEQLGVARSASDKRNVERIESDLMALQAEYDSRGDQIEKIAGIFRALTK
jgi:hypothetical protein